MTPSMQTWRTHLACGMLDLLSADLQQRTHRLVSLAIFQMQFQKLGVVGKVLRDPSHRPPSSSFSIGTREPDSAKAVVASTGSNLFKPY